MKKHLKRLLPSRLLLGYHYFLARAATLYYRFPSRGMIIVGVTGTKGKTSTANFLWAALMAGGMQTGIITTANIRVGREEWLNPYHMTMPGPFALQKLLAKMRRAGCRYAIVETTSEGIKQHRHVGIEYDVAIFTNLTPEHLRSHGGSFEEYKKTKGKIFAALSSSRRKMLNGTRIPKVIIAGSGEHAPYFLGFFADRAVTFGVGPKAGLRAEHIEPAADGVSFRVGSAAFHLAIPGEFNVSNALPAIIIARTAGVDDAAIAEGFASLKTIPGRMERIDMGQNFTVFVDYAHEGESVRKVLETAQAIGKQGGSIIVLLGAEGGGRDIGKRKVMGALTGSRARYVVVCNVDPYEDDPQKIAEDIATAAEQAGKVREKNLFVILDRRQGIRKALSLARHGDIVLITGKGAEQSIILGGVSIPWDDRRVVREELGRLHSPPAADATGSAVLS